MDRRASETQAHFRAIAAAADPGRASEIATVALSKGLRHPAFHAARARWFELRDCPEEALSELRQAFDLAPRDAELLVTIGLTLLKLNRFAKAIAAFDAAIRIAPAWAQTHYHRGCACSAAGELAAALHSYERAIALEPKHADALAALAAAAARGGETAKARPFAERALRAIPAHPTAVIALVMCDLHDKEFVRARNHLDTLLSKLCAEDQTRALALGLLGDALDGEGRTEAAFAAYAAKNEILRNLYGGRFDGETRLLNRVEQLVAGLEAPAMASAPRSEPASTPARQHVFLLGFMRSGTTLLEQVLAVEPDVESLEERETFGTLSDAYLSSGSSGLEKLALLSGDNLNRARETYWQRVKAFGAKPEGRIVLEKQPFNTLNIPLIATLFPSAKIVFLVRDPRDVMLSCFRRHLEVRPTTFELLTLAGAARFYDRVMHLAEICRSRFPLEVLECRYEDLVLDFENSVRSICGFLGMQWKESMRDFDRSARSKTIRSVSSNQVRRGLYPDGVGQWRRYEKQLSPILPAVQPWVERFGYPAN